MIFLQNKYSSSCCCVTYTKSQFIQYKLKMLIMTVLSTNLQMDLALPLQGDCSLCRPLPRLPPRSAQYMININLLRAAQCFNAVQHSCIMPALQVDTLPKGRHDAPMQLLRVICRHCIGVSFQTRTWSFEASCHPQRVKMTPFPTEQNYYFPKLPMPH